MALVQVERVTRTAAFSAPVPLLVLPGLTMADNICAVTVGAAEDLHDHDVTPLCGVAQL